jgi:opacity protein-like surface antigen
LGVVSFQDLPMPHAFKISGGVYTIACSRLWTIVLLLMFLPGTIAVCGVTEQPETAPKPVPAIPSPPPPLPEQILSPIPRQFDWMRREVHPNPALEAVLGLQEVTPRLLMTISLGEEYSDNFFLEERDREEEYRTRLTVGTVYRLESGRSFVSLANSLSGTYDARAEQGNFAFANLAFNVGHQLPRLSLALSESFVRSDQVEEARPTGVRRERQTFTTNTISPQVRYDLTPRTALTGAYTNTLVWNENGGGTNGEPADGDQRRIQGDSISHAFSTGLQHRFTPNLIGGGNYTFTIVDSEQESDTLSHGVTADLGYVINPRTSTSLRAFGTSIDRRDGTTGGDRGEIDEGDSNIYGLSLGVQRQLTTFLTAFVEVGPTVVSRENRPTRVFANWQASLGGSLPLTRRTSLSFATQQSITDTAGDIDDVGLVQSQSATATLNYTILRNLFASVFANYTRTELLEDIATNVSTQNREFTSWSTGATLSYALTPVWSLSMRYQYQRRDSDVPAEATFDGTRLGGSFDENRVILSLTAAIPIF